MSASKITPYRLILRFGQSLTVHRHEDAAVLHGHHAVQELLLAFQRDRTYIFQIDVDHLAYRVHNDAKRDRINIQDDDAGFIATLRL